MSHMVIFQGTDGKPGYHQADRLEDAARFVERLRNDDLVEHAQIFSMDEVPFEFKPYFKVELPPADEEPSADVAPMRPIEVPADGDHYEPVERPRDRADDVEPPTPIGVGSGEDGVGRRGLFGR